MEATKVLNLDPAKVLAEDNARFNLKPGRIESMAQSILEANGVLQPVGVEPIVPPVNGFDYRLKWGFYRHAAALKLNAEQGVGLTLPAIVGVVDEATRLRQQITENMDRENMSPMDSAVAIKKLLESGVPRGEVRRIFTRPGGKKGTTMQPASNAWMNIVLRFLELPKTVQEKIHHGIIGVEAAYELGKVPPEKRAAVIERAEAERQRQLEIEEKDEEKYLTAESKHLEAKAKETEALSAVDAARKAVTDADRLIAEKAASLKTVQAEPYLGLEEPAKKVLAEKVKAAAADLKAAEKISKDAKNVVAKLLNTAKTAAETAEAQKAKLDAVRKAAVKGKKPNAKQVGKADVKAAAKAEGVDTGVQPLNATEVRDAVKQLTKVSDWPKVKAIGMAMKRCLDGITTPKELSIELSWITGESKAPVKGQAVTTTQQ